MQYFEKQGNALIFRQDGETVRVEPWQKDSLRVRGTLLSEIEEGSIALLDPEPVEAEIELVDERKATIKNGKIQAILELQPWGQKLRITFLNQKGEVLLSEIANGGALCLRAHDYRALPMVRGSKLTKSPTSIPRARVSFSLVTFSSRRTYILSWVRSTVPASLYTWQEV